MTTVETFFAPAPGEALRTPSGKPLLVPRGLEGKGIRADYSRASGLAEFIEESAHIHRWEMRYLAKAMGQNEDLAALAAVETYSTGIKDAVFGREKSASGRRLDSIIERALDRVRLHEKADRGTAVHAATEPGGVELEQVPERLRGAVKAFWESVRVNAIDLVDTEAFTANDTTMSAGTFDHLVRVPGHPLLTDYVIADKKTGRFSPFEWTVQLSSYANGDRYDLETDTRPEWPGPINKKWGLVWQIDCEPKTPDDQRVKLHIIDLEFGWEMAQLAAKVRDAHERRDIVTDYRPAGFNERLAASTTTEDLRRLWESTTDEAERSVVEEKARHL